MILVSVNPFYSGLGIAGGPVHGAKAAGMGTAFVGIADDPSTILHNPAGLGNLSGFQVYGGITVLSPETSFTSPADETEHTEREYYFPPNFYMSWNPDSSELVFGLGIFSPFWNRGAQMAGQWPHAFCLHGKFYCHSGHQPKYGLENYAKSFFGRRRLLPVR
jgi:long-subunit fatty acid transport protein